MSSPTRSDELPRRIVLGLGNPGPRYAETRHNVGFRVIDELAERRRIRLRNRACNTLLGWDDHLTLAAPQTYMNRSGYAVRCLTELYAFEPEELLVVYDEVQLPLGALRLRRRGSPGGHRGMESVIENLGTECVPRLRLGVAEDDGPPGGDEIVDYVLAPFRDLELREVEEMIVRAADACELWAREGAEAAMRQFNG